MNQQAVKVVLRKWADVWIGLEHFEEHQIDLVAAEVIEAAQSSCVGRELSVGDKFLTHNSPDVLRVTFKDHTGLLASAVHAEKYIRLDQPVVRHSE